MNSEIDPVLYQRVVQLVANELNCNKKELHPESRFYHDLGCTGLDGEELLKAFRDEFHVDTSNFVFDRHFGPECGPGLFDLFTWCWYWIFERDQLNQLRSKMVPITLLDLYEAAKSGKFPDLSARAPE